MHTSRFFKKKNERGFTLVEMLVVIALVVILTGAVFESILAFYRFNGYTIAQAYQIDHARRGIESLVRDLREMTYSDTGTFPLAVKEDTRVGFYSDIDRDNSVEYVEYTLASTTLYKKIYSATGTPPVYSITPESTTTISEYVQNTVQSIPIFVYYTDTGVPAVATTTVTDIRYVEVSVIVNIDMIRDPGQYMLRSSASLRNLKD
jgi:prepilin-type N-terminal cleavage/methylation domain-containing protein